MERRASREAIQAAAPATNGPRACRELCTAVLRSIHSATGSYFWSIANQSKNADTGSRGSRLLRRSSMRSRPLMSVPGS